MPLRLQFAWLLPLSVPVAYLDWRGYVIALFALVWVANQYMSIYNRLRLDIKHEQVQIHAEEQDKKEEAAGEVKLRAERAA